MQISELQHFAYSFGPHDSLVHNNILKWIYSTPLHYSTIQGRETSARIIASPMPRPC